MRAGRMVEVALFDRRGTDWEQKRRRKSKARPQGRTGLKVARRKRFELLTYRFVACCSIQLGYRRIRNGESLPKFFGAPEEIRTPDLQVRSLLLYPAGLPARTRDKVYTSVRGGSSRNNYGFWAENRKSVAPGGERVFGNSGQAAIPPPLIPRTPLGLGPAPGRAVAAATVLFFLFP